MILQSLLVREECVCEHSVVFIVPEKGISIEGLIDATTYFSSKKKMEP
jgi:hypothetical protein